VERAEIAIAFAECPLRGVGSIPGEWLWWVENAIAGLRSRPLGLGWGAWLQAVEITTPEHWYRGCLGEGPSR
jgi:hypothetical protein